MTTRPLLCAAALAAVSTIACSTASARIDRQVEKTFTVAPGGTARISTEAGSVRVITADGDRVVVVAREHIRASSDADADALLRHLELTVAADPAGVTATSHYADRQMGWHFGSWPPVQVDFEVTVPRRYSAQVHTSGGNVSIGSLDGTVFARTSGGNVELGRITGTVDAATSGGNVRLEGSGSHVLLATSGGNVEAGPVAGAADVRTSGGRIEIASAGGPVSAHTSGGEIEATFSRSPSEDCSFSSSGGSIRLTVPRDAGFQLDAATSGGSVRADGLPITPEGGGLGRSHLAGRIGPGGPKVRLRTSGGDVIVRAAD